MLLDGDVETSGAALKAPGQLAALFSDFLTWTPEPPPNAETCAANKRNVSATTHVPIAK